MIVAFILMAVLAGSWLLTMLVRQYALSKKLFDIPNARSSHVVPTPRGGGVAIVISFSCVLLAVFFTGMVSTVQLCALLGSGLLVAVIGFVDDHSHLDARWRLAAHFIAGAWALFWLGGLAPFSFFGVVLNLGWVGNFFAIIYIVWMLNLYNFMDGIDGLASAEAICACIGSALIFWLAGNDSLVFAPLLLASAVSGFIYWNFPPAKIFMGDAGSGFLGVTLAVLSICAAWVSSELMFVWLIMLGVFIVDSTWTLIRRLLRGEAIYQAHRSHAYQYASRRFKSHKKITVSIVFINVVWLWPLGLLVGLHCIEPVLGLLIAYLPLIGGACYFNAGSSEVGA
ncbi:Fuc2NAc and GlcNAc transferase [Pseudomonas sp. 29]|uniref:MraY family glycosyltransferase n=1 Tax=Pseudomonas sp. 29 TaxID=2035197 RepID=UPI000C18E346|nr:glycosyltransferase family 4 protein [Pseudomonas sp. 29]PIF48657.1 Fuc2NAc and GlcNAc transferase [Pseudomonas sp. 29]